MRWCVLGNLWIYTVHYQDVFERAKHFQPDMIITNERENSITMKPLYSSLIVNKKIKLLCIMCPRYTIMLMYGANRKWQDRSFLWVQEGPHNTNNVRHSLCTVMSGCATEQDWLHMMKWLCVEFLENVLVLVTEKWRYNPSLSYWLFALSWLSALESLNASDQFKQTNSPGGKVWGIQANISTLGNEHQSVPWKMACIVLRLQRRHDPWLMLARHVCFHFFQSLSLISADEFSAIFVKEARYSL